MANGVLCPECLSFEEDRKNSDTVVASHEATKPYGWGKAQGVLLILSSFQLLGYDRSEDNPAFSVPLFIFNLALGICIFRRNRLILPLMGVAMILFTLAVTGASASRDELGAAYAFGFVVWLIYCFYYYSRRSEFKRWL